MEIIERELTPEEIAEHKAWAAAQLEREQHEMEREKSRTSAQAKLKKLGLTDNEISALLS